jgi:hypothetical protein
LVDFSPIINFCCILVIWLHLKAGVSRKIANIVLKAIQFILTAQLGLIQIALEAQLGTEIKLPEIQLPQDVRTAFRTQFPEPKIQRTACCPKCFTLYPDLSTMPEFCTHKDTPLSWVCDAPLYRKEKQERIDRGLKPLPRTWYNTQNFRSWLEWFLSQPEVEDHLQSTFERTATAGTEMYNFQDSPAWAGTKEFRTSKYHLVFAWYIDWFNPFTNKISGWSPPSVCLPKN